MILNIIFSCFYLLSTGIICMNCHIQFYVVLGIKLRALCIQGRCSIDRIHPKSKFVYICILFFITFYFGLGDSMYFTVYMWRSEDHPWQAVSPPIMWVPKGSDFGHQAWWQIPLPDFTHPTLENTVNFFTKGIKLVFIFQILAICYWLLCMEYLEKTPLKYLFSMHVMCSMHVHVPVGQMHAGLCM